MDRKQESYVLQRAVERAQGGDGEAFRELFDQLSDRLFAYALSHTGDREESLDVVQETFIELWDAMNSRKFEYKSDEAFYGFIFVILKRKLFRHYRRKRKVTLLSEITIEETYEMEHEDYRHLIRRIDSLAPKYQELLKLRYWSDMSFSEIASILNITETAAKVRHHRALKKLKMELEK